MNEIVRYRSRQEIAQLPEVQAALSQAERAVLGASLEKPVKECSAVEIAKDLNTALRFILLDVGCRVADEAERQYIVTRTAQILNRYYPNLSLKDFRLAFELSVTGELDAYLPKDRNGIADRNHYQQFNAEYICKILNAYGKYRAGAFSKAYEAEPKPEKKFDDAYYQKRAKEDCYGAYLYYKYHNKLPDLGALGAVSLRVYINVLNAAGLAEKPNIGDGLDNTLSAYKMLEKRLKNAFDRMIINEIQLGDFLR